MKNFKMQSWTVVARRELSAYFASPVSYIVGALFLLFSGFLFFTTFFLVNRAELRGFFELLPFLFAFFIPALTMKTFSEEKRSGTIETLVTLPAEIWQIVLGKYAASFLSSAALLLPTIFYVVPCVIFASGGIDFGTILGGYLGGIFLAAAFSAVGIFSSAVTKNQIVSFFAGFAICIFLTMISAFSIFLPGVLVKFASFVSASAHFRSVARGIIDSRDILYFVSVSAIFVSLAIHSVENFRRGK